VTFTEKAAGELKLRLRAEIESARSDPARPSGERARLSSALGQLASIEFPQKTTLLPELDQQFKALTGLQKEFWDAVRKPKASRRPTLVKEYMDTTAALLETLDKLTATLAATVSHQDATTDHLLAE